MNTHNPVVVTAVFSPKEHAYEELVTRLKTAIAEVHAEPGCLTALTEIPHFCSSKFPTLGRSAT